MGVIESLSVDKDAASVAELIDGRPVLDEDPQCRLMSVGLNGLPGGVGWLLGRGARRIPLPVNHSSSTFHTGNHLTKNQITVLCTAYLIERRSSAFSRPNVKNTMSMIKQTIGTVFCAVILAGCSSSKDASNSNFKKVLDAHFAKDCVTIQPFVMSAEGHQYPLTVALQPKNQNPSLQKMVDESNAAVTQPLEVLVQAGLLTVTEGTKKQPGLFGGSYTAPTKIYAVTDTGKKALVSPDSTAMCAGHYKVDEVTRFTEPSVTLGHTISQVSFTFSSVDVPNWAEGEKIRATYGLTNTLVQNARGSRTLVLASDGWIDADDFSK